MPRSAVATPWPGATEGRAQEAENFNSQVYSAWTCNVTGLHLKVLVPTQVLSVAIRNIAYSRQIVRRLGIADSRLTSCVLQFDS